MRSLIVTLAAAGCSYSPGAFAFRSQAFVGTRVTTGCVDLALHRRDDYKGAAVVQYQFGNRCDQPVVIDLAAVSVVGRTVAGRERALVAYDPKAEMGARLLDGRTVGKEAIAYPSEVELAQVCIDIASLFRDAPARWACL